MAIHVRKREYTTITPSMAKHFLEFNDFDTQRPIRRGHIEELKYKLKIGLFRTADIAFASLNGDKEQMMNGQHQCVAICETGISVEGVVENYKCDTLLDMSELFRQFEILPRSLKDFVRHERKALQIKWPLWVTSLIVSAAVIDYSSQPSYRGSPAGISAIGTRSNILSKEAKVKLLENYIEEGEFINEIMSCGEEPSEARRKQVRHISKAAVAFFMFETWRVNIKNSREFWINIRDGESLTREMPEMKYRDFLLSSMRHKGSYSPMIQNHEYIYRGHLAWNAFREGRTTNLAYRSNAEPPKLV